MATSPDPNDVLHSTNGKTNFQRIARLLISGGTTLLREIFDQICTPSNLPSKLADPGTEKQLKSAKLTKPQWDCLYPSPAVYGKSADFDITLLFRLLRTICNLAPPATGWDDLPSSTDCSLVADLVRIKCYRNSIYGHVNQNMEIEDEKFQSLWQEISEALVRIAGQISPERKKEWQAAINKFLNNPLTAEDERNIQELKRWYECDIEVKESIEELKKETQDIKDQLSEVRQSIDRLHYSAGSLQAVGAQLRLRIDCEAISGPGPHDGPSAKVANTQKPKVRVQGTIPSCQQGASAMGDFAGENRSLPTAQEVLSFIAHECFKVVDPSKPEELNAFLKYLIEVRKVLFVDAQQGSLIITVECSSLEILEGLWKDYCSGHLNEMAKKYLITEDVLKEFGLTEVKLVTTIAQEEYAACQKYLQSAVVSPHHITRKGSTDFSDTPHVETSELETQVPDEPEESISQQDNAGHNTAVENASQSITPSDHGDSTVNSNDDGDNYPANFDLQSKGSSYWRHVEIAPGATSMVAAPAVPTAAGVAAGPTAASVPSAGVYGDSAASATNGKTNFQRIARLLISGGTTLLREIFDQICTPSNLPTKLADPGTEKQLKSAKLTKPQWDCLYPSPGVYGKSADFDVTLLFRLLRTICNLTPPASGWDDLPSSRDCSLVADLVRIKYYRNSIYGHVNQNMEIADGKFQSLWQEISEVLLRIAGQISPKRGKEWQAAINNFLSKPLTAEDEQNVQELKRWYEGDTEVKESLEELKTTSQSFQRQLQEESRDTKDQLSEVQKSMDRLRYSAGSSLAGSDLLRCATIGLAVGATAVAAAPVVLSAAGFTAGGVAAGSIAASVQSAVYGGSVASGSVFAMLQSAGAAGIGAAGNAAIGGITGGIAALGARMFGNRKDIKLLICGCSTGAHAFAGIASSVKGADVRVLSLHKDEAERWSAAMQKNDLEVTLHRTAKEPTTIKSKPALVTKNPEDAMRDVDIVVFVLPAFAHQVYLDTLKPYIKPGTIIVGLPGGPGFEFQVREVLGDVARQCTIVNFESSPWVCRTTAFGVKCEVLGTMETLLGAIKQGEDAAPKKDPVSTLQYLLGPLPKLNIAGHLLGVQLMSTNAYLHTSILYGQWEGWDGKPLDESPLFYTGLTESVANLLSSVSDEIVNIGKTLEVKTEADMSNVVHIHQWHVRRYPHDISNKSTLYKAIQTNAAYQGLRHPVKTTEDGKYVPDFTHRYMTEDVPYGLVVTRGIAEIVGVRTPNIDKVLTWCQEKMGKEYLVNSKLQGKDVASSRAPQRYGFTTLESIL